MAPTAVPDENGQPSPPSASRRKKEQRRRRAERAANASHGEGKRNAGEAESSSEATVEAAVVEGEAEAEGKAEAGGDGGEGGGDDGEGGEGGECVVCLSGEREHAIVPCGHRCLCRGCAMLYGAGARCPLCRGPSVGVLRVYL